MYSMNDNESLKLGDRVRLREFPQQTGTIWDISDVLEDTVLVEWDNGSEDSIYVTNPRRWLEKIS